MKIHVTGFSSAEKLEMKRLAENFGLTFDQDFTLSTNILVCESVLAQKYKVGKIMGIKVVTRKWLFES